MGEDRIDHVTSSARLPTSFNTHPYPHLHPSSTHPSRRTKGFSGAEIEGVVKAAASQALERALLRTGPPLVGWADFEEALSEVRAFARAESVTTIDRSIT